MGIKIERASRSELVDGHLSSGTVRTSDPHTRVRWDVHLPDGARSRPRLTIAVFSWSDAVDYDWGAFASVAAADRKGEQVARTIATAADRVVSRARWSERELIDAMQRALRR